MILAQLLESSRKELQKNDILSYKIDSIIIICHDLDLTKEQLIFNSDLKVTEEQVKKVKSSIDRRILKEPVSKIIGKKNFYEDEFLVSSDVLDPRPDSETIIEEILNIFSNKKDALVLSQIRFYKKIQGIFFFRDAVYKRVHEERKKKITMNFEAKGRICDSATLKILELGVGSGCLVLTILKKLTNSNAIALDINQKSLEIAKINAKNLNLENRIEFIHSDWFSNLEPQTFDLIISNPPYIKSWDIKDLQEEVRNFDPIIALDGGEDGLYCYKIIAKDVQKFLKKDGYLLLEIGQNQEIDVIKIFVDNGLEFIKFRKDLGNIIRCLVFQNADI